MERAIENTDATADASMIEQNGPTLLEVITQLAEQHADGKLRIGDRGEIWFCDGRITLAVSPSSPDLTSVLVDANLGPEHELRSLLSGRRSDDGLGAAPPLHRLLDQRTEVHDTLARLLHEYRLSSLFELLVPGEVELTFDEGIQHPLGARFAEHAIELTDKATRRIDLWRRIAARIPATSVVFRWSSTLPRNAECREVRATEWRYLALLDGHHTVADVINKTGDSAFQVCSALYRLSVEGIIVESSAVDTELG